MHTCMRTQTITSEAMLKCNFNQNTPLSSPNSALRNTTSLKHQLHHTRGFPSYCNNTVIGPRSSVLMTRPILPDAQGHAVTIREEPPSRTPESFPTLLEPRALNLAKS